MFILPNIYFAELYSTYIECITYPYISTIHSYISTPAQHATRPSVLVCVMIYAGGKNNVIPHTTGLTSQAPWFLFSK